MSTLEGLSKITDGSKKAALVALETLKADLAKRGWEITEQLTDAGTVQIIAKKAPKA